MAVRTVRNSSEAHRWWNLTNVATQRTLELDPGERGDIDVEDDFEDPFLEVVAQPAKKSSASSSTQGASPPPADDAPAPDEPAKEN